MDKIQTQTLRVQRGSVVISLLLNLGLFVLLMFFATFSEASQENTQVIQMLGTDENLEEILELEELLPPEEVKSTESTKDMSLNMADMPAERPDTSIPRDQQEISQNLGGIEERFHNTQAGSEIIALPSVIEGSWARFITFPVSATGNLALNAKLTPLAGTPETTDTVMIREFSASNDNGPSDEDGDEPDWIEIYNGTGAPVDLGGYGLTDRIDEPGKWVFPTRILPQDARLVVFASNKDEVKRPFYGPDSELHTNFALKASGEFLGLSAPDGSFLTEFAPEYPPQSTDISYGQGLNDVVGFMELSPGAPNGPATSIAPAELEFSVPSGLFSSSFSVSISGQSASHGVRYTTDGSVPSPTNGATYTGPITISAGTTLRARSVTDEVGGPLAQATYSLRGTAIDYGIDPVTFSSSLPVLIIDAPAEPSGDRTPLTARFTLIDRDQVTGTASLTDTPAMTSRGTVRLRGQSSAGLPKKPYKIEFRGADDSQVNREVLGMPEESDWVLYAAYKFDPNFMRNVLAFDLYRRMGRWAPQTRFVEVFFNTSPTGSIDANSYRGVYVLMENIKIDKNRIDITELGPADNSGDAVTGGYIIGRDKWPNLADPHPELIAETKNAYPNWPFADGGDFIIKRPMVERITPAQRAFIFDYTQQIDTAVVQPDGIHPVTGTHVFDYIDAPSFIDHHMLNAFTKNVDGIRISTFFEKERGGKLAMSSVWDFDRSQDSDTDGRSANPFFWNSDGGSKWTDYFSNSGRFAEGWFHYLHLFPSYLQSWVDRYDELRSPEVFDGASIATFLDQRAAELTAPDNHGKPNANSPIARNFNRWPRSTRGVPTDGSNAAEVIFGSSASSEISRHKEWVGDRLDFMDSWVLPKPVASLAPGSVAVGSVLDLSAPDAGPSTEIYYTLDGSDPLASDGSVAPAAAIWTTPVTINNTMLITARVRDLSAPDKHTPWSPPFRGFYSVAGQAELVVHQWDFELVSDFLSPSTTLLDTSVNITPGPTSEVVRNEDGKGFASAHLRINDPLGTSVVWSLPTTGFQFPTLSWLTRRSGSGAGRHMVEYTSDGVTWIELESYMVADADPVLKTFDFTSVPAASDNPDFAVRVTFAQGAGDIAGNNRFDDVTLTAVPLPGANPPASLEFIDQPVAATSGSLLDPVLVRLLDADGFPATAFDGPVTLSLVGDGSLSGTLTVDAVNGSALFVDLVLTGTGIHQLTASAGSLGPVVSGAFQAVTLTELVMPRFIQGDQDLDNNNLDRVPFAFRLRIDGLLPSAPYRFGNRAVLASDAPDNDGAGNGIYITGSATDWIRNTDSPRFLASDAGVRHGSFTTDAAGAYTGWFVLEPSGNDRFTPGNNLFMRLLLNDGQTGETTTHSLTTSLGATVIPFGNGPGEGTGVIGQTAAAERQMVLLYDDASGSSRPLAATPVEFTGAGVDNRYVTFYQNEVIPNPQHWGGIIPNTLSAGLRRIEVRQLDSHALLELRADGDGFSGTLNPDSGTTPIRLGGIAGFEAWRVAEFTAAELADPAISGLDADPSGAGLANLSRYAFDLGRNELPAPRLPRLSSDLAYRFPMDASKAGIIYRVRASSDLADWSEIIYQSDSPTAPLPVDGWIELPSDPADGALRFYRLDVLPTDE